ncbi:SDR family oxidoreductase [Streptomyces sp. MBT65]|uniref:SDR family NAD(P)-dependent oxidoreductase n=1 Tax=Streptomyces sp. MBT65 TaxID=1488395 RepID=UPI00190A4965|nr:SDR family oxidoreductase [Streptomyces sp. MBT65]MBK3579449.1 SDR family oxidoreductase [Streptomyces sp. MBT65]
MSDGRESPTEAVARLRLRSCRDKRNEDRIAREYAAYGITANLVTPGLVRTEVMEDMPEEMRRELLDRTLLKRPAEPEEIADAVLWLADERSRCVTGAEIHVDGGLSLGA